MSRSSCSVCHLIRADADLGTIDGRAFCKDVPGRVGRCETIARHRAERARAVREKAAR